MPNNSNIEMYKIDLKNLTNLSEDSKTALQQEIDIIERQKQEALSNNEQNLNKEINTLESIKLNTFSTDQLINTQDKDINNIQNKLNNNDLNISTMKRQIQISLDETSKKNNKLFFLKIFLVYLLLCIIPIILIKNNILSANFGMYTLSIISLIFVSIFLVNVIKIRNRSIIDFQKTNFNKPNGNKIVGKKNIHQNLNNVYAANINYVDTLLNTLEKLKTRAIKLNDFETASMCQQMIGDIEQATAMGDTLGGYSSKAEIQNMIQKIRNEMKIENQQHRVINHTRITELLAKLKKEKALLKTLNSKLTTFNNKESTVAEQIKQVNEIIRGMENQLSLLRNGP